MLCFKHFLEVLWHYFFRHTENSAEASDASPENPANAPASVQSTDGPSAFKGVLGKNLQDSSAGQPSFWTADIVEFQPIEGGWLPDFSDEDLKVLSNDVQYLFKIFKLVTTGSKVCHPKTKENPLGGLESLRFANPGSLHHARWVTLCNRVLRYYVSQASPSAELIRVVTFAVRVYIPGWFLTINKQTFLAGPFLLQSVVANLQSLAEEDFFDTVEKYWHPKDAKKKKTRGWCQSWA